MPDISMCTGEGCSVKARCFRFTAAPNGDHQSYFAAPGTDETCPSYWPVLCIHGRYSLCPWCSGVNIPLPVDNAGAEIVAEAPPSDATSPDDSLGIGLRVGDVVISGESNFTTEVNITFKGKF